MNCGKGRRVLAEGRSYPLECTVIHRKRLVIHRIEAEQDATEKGEIPADW